MAHLNPYRVVTVEPGKAPNLAQHGQWYRYVIANHNTSVVGRRCGNREQVRRHAEHVAENLNDRARNNRSAWAPRRGKKAS